MMKYKGKERREKLGMSQIELIRKSGVSKATISKLENGNSDMEIKISTLQKLAAALKCSITSLIE
jgi:transcriptional regulator with XRE-family HTH domain